MGNPNCCFMIIAVTFFLQPIAEGNCEIIFAFCVVTFEPIKISTSKWPSKPQFCENWYRWHTVCMVSQSNKSLFEFKSYFPTQCQVWPNRDLWVEICNKIFKKSHSYTPFFNSRQSYFARYPKKCTDLFTHADRVQIFTAICPSTAQWDPAQWTWC